MPRVRRSGNRHRHGRRAVGERKSRGAVLGGQAVLATPVPPVFLSFFRGNLARSSGRAWSSRHPGPPDNKSTCGARGIARCGRSHSTRGPAPAAPCRGETVRAGVPGRLLWNGDPVECRVWCRALGATRGVVHYAIAPQASAGPLRTLGRLDLRDLRDRLRDWCLHDHGLRLEHVAHGIADLAGVLSHWVPFSR